MLAVGKTCALTAYTTFSLLLVLYANFLYNFSCSPARPRRKLLSPAHLDYLISSRAYLYNACFHCFCSDLW